ncbi:MAG: hypothetical protein IPN95_17490 [Bacteroidetes bacterium]|nr:hypothetical protein [Bacteroidota bacterium]
MSKIKKFSFLVGFALFLVIGQNAVSAQLSHPQGKAVIAATTTTEETEKGGQQQTILFQGSGILVPSDYPILAGMRLYFSNCCYRECSGVWSQNQNNNWTCSGTAGPLTGAGCGISLPNDKTDFKD